LLFSFSYEDVLSSAIIVSGTDQSWKWRGMDWRWKHHIHQKCWYFYKTTWCHIPEDSIVISHCR